MALTGSFSDVHSGLLFVTLTGEFASGGVSGRSNAGNVIIRGYFGPSGSPSYTPWVDAYQTSASSSVVYPGGGVVWPVGVEVVDHAVDWTGIVVMKNIKFSFQLIKR